MRRSMPPAAQASGPRHLLTRFPNVGYTLVTSRPSGSHILYFRRGRPEPPRSAPSDPAEPERTRVSERNSSWRSKGLISVGAAVLGVPASTAVAGASAASAATIKEAGSPLVFPLVNLWKNKYTSNPVSPASVGSGKG